MADTTTTDDDIIIFEDDTEEKTLPSEDKLEVEEKDTKLDNFNLDENKTTEPLENNLVEDNLVDLSNIDNQEDKEENLLDLKEDSNEVALDGLDFSVGVEEMSEEETNSDSLASMGFEQSNTDEISNETLNSIIEGTINKLNGRKDIIAESMRKKDELIKEIDNKIGTLRKDKKTATDNKNKMKKELEKIELNNKELEKMKMKA